MITDDEGEATPCVRHPLPQLSAFDEGTLHLFAVGVEHFLLVIRGKPMVLPPAHDPGQHILAARVQ